MKTADVERFRKTLEAEEQSLTEELRELQSAKAHASEAEVAMEMSGYDDHPADMASDTFQREKDEAMLESLEDSLAQVRSALGKIKRGTYGKCDSCGRQIGVQRLRALPHATLCVDCQGRRETI